MAAAVTRVLSQAYYARKNTILPAVAAGIGLVLHLSLAPYMMASHGLNGLVFSTSLAAVVNGTCLVAVLAASGLFRVDRAFLWFFARCALSAVPMFFFARWLSGEFYNELFLGRFALLFLAMAGSGVIYFAATHVLAVPESRTTLNVLRRKILKRQ